MGEGDEDVVEVEVERRLRDPAIIDRGGQGGGPWAVRPRHNKIQPVLGGWFSGAGRPPVGHDHAIEPQSVLSGSLSKGFSVMVTPLTLL
jgi:hypothetical protein